MASIVLDFDTQGADTTLKELRRIQKEIRETGKATASNASQSSKAVKSQNQLAAGFGAVAKAAGALAAGAGIVSFLSNSISAGNELQRNLGGIQGLLKSTGNAAGTSAEEINRFAGQLGRDTLTSRGAVLEASRALLSFKSIAGDTFFDTIRISQDLAETMGVDLKGATVQVAKALEDPVRGLTALRRSGVSFTESQRQMIIGLAESGNQLQAQTEILKILEGQFGGAGKAAAVGLGASLDTLGESLTDLQASVGAELGEVLTPFVDSTIEVIDNLDNIPEPAKRAVAGMKELLVDAGTAATTLAEDLGPALSEAGTLASEFASFAVDGFRSLIQILGQVGPAIAPILESFNALASTALNALRQTQQAVAILSGNFGDSVESVEALENATAVLGNESLSALQKLKTAQDAQNSAIEAGTGITEKQATANAALKSQIEGTIAANEQQIATLRAQIAPGNELNNSLRAQVAELENRNKSLKEGAGDLKTNATNTKQLSEATAKQIENQRKAVADAAKARQADAKAQLEEQRKLDELSRSRTAEESEIQRKRDESTAIEGIEKDRDTRIAEAKKGLETEIANLKQAQQDQIEQRTEAFNARQRAEETAFAAKQRSEEKAFVEEITQEREAAQERLSEAQQQVSDALEAAEDGRITRAERAQIKQAAQARQQQQALREQLEAEFGVTDAESELENLDNKEEQFQEKQRAEEEAFRLQLQNEEKAFQQRIQDEQRQFEQVLQQQKELGEKQLEQLKQAFEDQLIARKQAAEDRERQIDNAHEDAKIARESAAKEQQRKLDLANAKEIEGIRKGSETPEGQALQAESAATRSVAETQFKAAVAASDSQLQDSLRQAATEFNQSIADSEAQSLTRKQQIEQQLNQQRQQLEQKLAQLRQRSAADEAKNLTKREQLTQAEGEAEQGEQPTQQPQVEQVEPVGDLQNILQQIADGTGEAEGPIGEQLNQQAEELRNQSQVQQEQRDASLDQVEATREGDTGDASADVEFLKKREAALRSDFEDASIFREKLFTLIEGTTNKVLVGLLDNSVALRNLLSEGLAVQGLRTGGTFKRGDVNAVGEEGMELVRWGQSGRVFSNADSLQLLKNAQRFTAPTLTQPLPANPTGQTREIQLLRRDLSQLSQQLRAVSNLRPVTGNRINIDQRLEADMNELVNLTGKEIVRGIERASRTDYRNG